ncbi:hypothetical protein EI77_00371 [Prosthecobacter fusiformis]|uniref:Uncharacterized protein n=1 Tax=Prosthecobacter fusiformis TaxID=48464 RepID=A0A4R7SR21_9BACT|nr:hypothetical protein EI77_00371 [Prosthecobacter fusiformis]
MTGTTDPTLSPTYPRASYGQSLPKWLAFGMPVAMLIYPLFLLIPALNWEAGLNREYGLMENLTAVFLLSAFVIYLRTFPLRIGKYHGCWLLVLALGAFVFLGEEISWGQHFFGFDTPDDWKSINRQRETNIHNLSGTVEFIFTKVIRGALSTGCIVGGLIIPWICTRLKPTFVSDNMKSFHLQFWLWPSLSSAFVGILANTVGIPAKIANHYDAVLPTYLGLQVGELKEAFLALFILLYAVTQYYTARQLKPAQ